MLKIKERIIVAFLVFTFFPLINFAQVSDNVDVKLIIEGCNNNSICEPVIGEDVNNCPLDCSVVPPTDPPEEDASQDSSRKKGSMRLPVNDLFSEILQPQPEYQYLEPQNIRVKIDDNIVSLFWENPNKSDFDFVRVTKNNFHSSDPYQGILIYEGESGFAQDYLEEFDKDYFYNFFAKYEDNSFSDGVWVKVKAIKPSLYEEIRTEIKDDVKFEPETKLEQIFYTPKITIYDIQFLQLNKKLSWEDQRMKSYAGIPIEVSLPKNNYFGPLNDIFLYVNFFDAKDEKFLRQEILKFDYVRGFDVYKAKIFDVNLGEVLNVKVVLMDGSQEYTVAGIIDVEEIKIEDFQKSTTAYSYYVLLLIVIIILLLIIIKKMSKNEKKTL